MRIRGVDGSMKYIPDDVFKEQRLEAFQLSYGTQVLATVLTVADPDEHESASGLLKGLCCQGNAAVSE